MLRAFAATISFCLFVGLTTAATSNTISAGTDLRRVIIVHRHGARTPLLTNPDQCGPLGCGQLSPEGRSMLGSLGLFIRQRYSALLFPDMSSPTFSEDLMNFYDPAVSGSRSSGESRTVQSAEALMQALFSGSASADTLHAEYPFFPATYTRPPDNDPLLRPQTTPSNVMWTQATNTSLFSYMTDVVMPQVSINYTNLEGQQTLKLIGEELSLGGECTSPNLRPKDQELATYNPFVCLLDAQDYSWFLATTYNTSEFSGRYPTVFAHFNALNAAMQAYNEWWYFKYDDMFGGGNYSYNAGSVGYTLADAVVTTAEQSNHSTSTSSNASSMVFVDYSTHDTTIMPLAMAFGNKTIMRPDFAAAFVFEIRQDASNGNVYLVASYGNCDQSPGSNHTYTFEPFLMKCMDASGAIVEADSCLVTDVRRYIDTHQKARSPMGSYCYLSEAMMKDISCAPSDVLDPDIAFKSTCSNLPMFSDAQNACVLQQLCAQYRQRCPEWACALSEDSVRGGSLDSDWNCQPITTDTPTAEQAAEIAALRDQLSTASKDLHILKIALGTMAITAVAGGFVIFICSIKMAKARREFLAENNLPYQRPLTLQQG